MAAKPMDAHGGGPVAQTGGQGPKHQKMVALSNKLTSIYSNNSYINAMNAPQGTHGGAGG